MDFTSLTARIREWKSEMKQTLAASNSVPIATDSPEWYAGLAVSPASFSRQLGEMQLSMLRENTPMVRTGSAGDAQAEPRR